MSRDTCWHCGKEPAEHCTIAGGTVLYCTPQQDILYWARFQGEATRVAARFDFIEKMMLRPGNAHSPESAGNLYDAMVEESEKFRARIEAES